MIEKHAPYRNKKITQAAKGEECTMNVAGVCNYNSATTVLIHFRWIGDCGGSQKPPDLQAAFGCSECNRWTDSPTPKERNADYESDRNFYAIRAMSKTLQRLIERGILKVC